MATCERSQGCPIYNYFRTDALKNYYIRSYCDGNYDLCERLKLRKAGKPIPDSLLPDGKELSIFHSPKK